MKQEEEYWLKKFSGELIRCNFHYDLKESVSNVRIIDSVGFRFPGEFSTKLIQFYNNSEVDLFKFLVSGIVALLGKYSYTQSGMKDIVIGVPIYKIDTEINSRNTILALRNQFEENISFHNLFSLVGQSLDEAMENSAFNIEDLPKQLKMKTFGDDFPLFDVAITLDNIHDKRYLRNIYVNTIFSFFCTPKYIDGVVEYNASLYEKETIKQIIRRFTKLLTQALMNFNNELFKIEILSDEERKQILFDFNNTKTEYQFSKTLHEIFEEQVEKNPDSTALVFEDHHLTFLELSKKANVLARLLIKKGINENRIAGVMVNRSIEMIIALLSVLKAGGAYVPIDPEYPIDRIKFYLSDCETNILLTQYEIIKNFENNGFNIEGIDLFEKSIFIGDTSDLKNTAHPDDIAYIIFTSGSTGKPKGVMIRHRNAINFIKGISNQIDFSKGKIILALTTISFDIFFLETLMPITLGLKIIIANERQQKDPLLLKEIIMNSNVTLLQATPSRLKLLLSSGSNFNYIKKIEAILVGGEAFPRNLFEQLKQFYSGKIYDVYGPTETTVWSTLKDLTGLGEINIGKPIANTQIYILDKYLNPQPVGTVGELYIGGDGIAIGYLNRQSLTQERFIENPFSETSDPDRPYKKIYQTGDLARWLPNGEIDFLGRIDYQVKIRGFRIETGEIETQIQKFPQIKEAVVIAREDTGGEKFLCAYFVSEVKINLEILEAVLSKSLLDYMIPSFFIQIDAIPLTPNGKVDRKKLPDPKITGRREGYIAPRDEIEAQLVAMWAEELHIEKNLLSIDDNFFKIGGHSLKAAVIITKIHKELNVKIQMHDFFEMPTVRKLSEFLRGAQIEFYTPIKKAPEMDFYPLISAQKRLYFMHRLEPNSTVYNIQLMDVYCKGIEIIRLKDAFKKLIERHESLRTSFLFINGEAVQKILTFEEIVNNIDIEYFETAEDGMIFSNQTGKEWTKITGLPFQEIVEHFVRPFDLSQPPLIRAGLIKIWGDTQILMLDMHHIVSDGVSEVIIIKELWKLYDGEFLTPLKIQYKDFSVWANSPEILAEFDNQETYWLNELAGEIPILNLPTDYPRPSKMSFEGDSFQFEIDKDSTHQISIIAQESGATLYMILIALYNILLSKLSGQNDIIIGTFAAGRGHADILDIVGMFVDTLVLRNYPTGDKTFNLFLEEVKSKTLTAFENQGFPFERLVSKVSPNSERNRNPLFDVALVLENEAEQSEAYLLEVLLLDKFSPYSFNVKKSKFDIELRVAETSEGMQFKVEFNTSLFKLETIERFAKYFEKIVNSVCRNKYQKISDIEIITVREKNQILYEFNNTKSEYPQDKTIFQVFQEQVEKNGDRIAIIFKDNQLSYREFNEKSNQLAIYLRKKGVLPEHIIGIIIERSLEMMIGIFAIQKAGGAYLPMEPHYPKNRIEYLLKDSGTKFLLTLGKFFKILSNIEYTGEIINLEKSELYNEGKENLKLVNSSKDIAYIIYTSGSTGKPKGVMIEHFAVINRINWMQKMYPIYPGDVILQKTTFVFDVSVWELFWWSFQGASQCLLIPGGEKDPAAIIESIEKNKITTMHFVPSMLNVFLYYIEGNSNSLTKTVSLRSVFASGEALTPFQVEKFNELVFSRTKKSKLINLYGPTEATVDVSFYECSSEMKHEKVPIGKPIDNTHLYVINNNTSLQPISIAGELCITGDQLARGYLNRPELTSEKFIFNPYQYEGDWGPLYSRLYRTGDLAHWLPNGNIEYLGRIDFQVKVRGFRIELGEIETQLLKIEKIKEAIVIAKENSKKEKFLCAYYVVNDPIDIKTIRDSLSKNMPEYMVPSFFIEVEKIPITSNGKLDRKALPEAVAKASAEYTPPTNKVEKIVLEVWQEILRIEKIGIDDNFFEIGGDSIKTIIASARLLKKGLYLHVNDFFSNKTIRELSRCIKPIEQKNDTIRLEKNIEQIHVMAEKDYNNYIDKINNEIWPDLNNQNNYQNILLTGATGYLGAYLVYELLKTTNAKLFLPIRGNSLAEAEERFKNKIAYYFNTDFNEILKDRITVLKSDLREKHLGLEFSQYNNLSNIIDAVIHSAANVKHFGLYEEFYKDNVETTKNLLDFAINNRKKDFHFISTIDTSRGNIPGKDYVVFTEYDHDIGQSIDEVYIKSKFEAEKLVLNYRRKGINTTIFRAANMTFDSETGRFQENINDNFFYSMLKAFIKVGFWTEEMINLKFDLSFVNFSAKSIVLLLTRKGFQNQTYHIINPNSFNWRKMHLVLAEIGLKLPDINPQKIQSDLSNISNKSEFEKIIERVKIYAWEWTDTGGTLTFPKCDRTVTLLKKFGFDWPVVNSMHIEKMINHCREVGFI